MRKQQQPRSSAPAASSAAPLPNVAISTSSIGIHICGIVGDAVSQLADRLELVRGTTAVRGDYDVLENNTTNNNNSSQQYLLSFWPLLPSGTQWTLRLINGNDERETATTADANSVDSESISKKPQPQQNPQTEALIAQLNAKQVVLGTKPSPFNDQTLPLIDRSFLAIPSFAKFITRTEGDYLLLLALPQPALYLSPEFLLQIFRHGLFMLPSDKSPVWSLPNCERRFCIDLSSSAEWLGGKKVKRYLKDFSLEVTSNFADTLKVCMTYHNEKNGGTWLTPAFIAALQGTARLLKNAVEVQTTQKQTQHLPRLMSFILREREEEATATTTDPDKDKKKPGRIVAATFGFLLGSLYHDYTMSTFVSDSRSCGTLLSKLSCHVLHRAGVQLYYWGMKSSAGTSYMQEFEGSKYRGVELPRVDFYEKWWVPLRDRGLERDFGASIAEACDAIHLPVRVVL